MVREEVHERCGRRGGSLCSGLAGMLVGPFTGSSRQAHSACAQSRELGLSLVAGDEHQLVRGCGCRDPQIVCRRPTRGRAQLRVSRRNGTSTGRTVVFSRMAVRRAKRAARIGCEPAERIPVLNSPTVTTLSANASSIPVVAAPASKLVSIRTVKRGHHARARAHRRVRPVVDGPVVVDRRARQDRVKDGWLLAVLPQWPEFSHRPAVDGDREALTVLDPPQDRADVVPKFACGMIATV